MLKSYKIFENLLGLKKFSDLDDWNVRTETEEEKKIRLFKDRISEKEEIY